MRGKEPPGRSGVRRRPRWWTAAGLLAPLLLVLLVVLWVKAPALYGTSNEAKTAAATTRGAILTVLAALIAATAAIAALAETQRANRESDQRDRYAKAIELLGSDKLDVRLGGIYELARIAETSERDQADFLRSVIRSTGHAFGASAR